MTKIEALELELKARKMVEGTVMQWWQVIRSDYKIVCKCPPPSDSPYGCELALGIVEGKPVWNDSIIFKSNGFKAYTRSVPVCDFHLWLWNPPAPKTIMIELPIDVVKNWAEYYHGATEILASACRKALEMK